MFKRIWANIVGEDYHRCGAEKLHRGSVALLYGTLLLVGLSLFFPGGGQWVLKVMHSAAEALLGVYLFYWGTRWLIVSRVHELEGAAQRHRELILVAGAALVVAGALSG